MYSGYNGTSRGCTGTKNYANFLHSNASNKLRRLPMKNQRTMSEMMNCGSQNNLNFSREFIDQYRFVIISDLKLLHIKSLYFTPSTAIKALHLYFKVNRKYKKN